MKHISLPIQLDIDLSSYASSLKIRNKHNTLEVWDPCRKKYIALTPEESVRQTLVLFLHEKCDVGYGRMIAERSLINKGAGRFDLGLYNRDGTWNLLAECKSFKVKLSQDTIMQAARYNTELEASTVLITNGKETYAWKSTNPVEWVTDPGSLVIR